MRGVWINFMKKKDNHNIQNLINNSTLNMHYIKRNINIFEIRDNLWQYSRWFGNRYGQIIALIDEEYYFTALLNLIILVENYQLSKKGNYDMKHSQWIEQNITDEDENLLLNELRKLRNKMAHANLIEYYIEFNNDTLQYPLNEESNYEIFLAKFFLFLSSQLSVSNNIKNNQPRKCMFKLKKYSVEDIVTQYGFSLKSYYKVLHIGINNTMNKKEQDEIKKINKLNFLRSLDNTSPVALFEQIFKNLHSK